MIGRAPDCSSLARFCAESIVKPPSICEPLVGSMPSGFWVKSMNGTVISWPSSTTAKCCWACALGTPGSWAACPRWAICLVTCWKTLPPWELKPKVTTGEPLPPGPLLKLWAGLRMSLPVST